MRKKQRILSTFLIFCIGGIVASASNVLHLDAAQTYTEESVIAQQSNAVKKKYRCSGVNITIKLDDLRPCNIGTNMSKEDIELIALVTMAEAEGESEYGKRLVIDTVLNRMDSVNYPDTIREVIYQQNQFTSMWNGRVDRCYVTDDIFRLVEEELLDRRNDEVIFFTAGDYGKYGIPMFQEGNHYFSKEE